MSIIEGLKTINWLAVLVAPLASLALGFLWYGLLFAKAWVKASGVDEEAAKNASPLMYLYSYLLAAVVAIALSMFLHDGASAYMGLKIGMLAGGAFAGTSLIMNTMYEQKGMNLMFINAMYQVLNMGAIGAIIGAWQ